MTAKEAKHSRIDIDISLAGSRKAQAIKPGRLNFGSHLDPERSLSARLRAEINRRYSVKKCLELK
ncbi:MAG: hypothetical protein J7J91_03765 [Deltaproteobacteria bacterium]|nr:hypothetical protein [Deltaproteobacteria bacterium]